MLPALPAPTPGAEAPRTGQRLPPRRLRPTRWGQEKSGRLPTNPSTAANPAIATVTSGRPGNGGNRPRHAEQHDEDGGRKKRFPFQGAHETDPTKPAASLRSYHFQIIPIGQRGWGAAQLVPKHAGGDVVLQRQVPASGAIPGPESTQILLEADGILDVPAVHAELLLTYVGPPWGSPRYGVLKVRYSPFTSKFQAPPK